MRFLTTLKDPKNILKLLKHPKLKFIPRDPAPESSGAHEWINEGPAVPARVPVKPTEPVHRPASPRRERRPRGALPQPGVGFRVAVRSVGGRR